MVKTASHKKNKGKNQEENYQEKGNEINNKLRAVLGDSSRENRLSLLRNLSREGIEELKKYMPIPEELERNIGRRMNTSSLKKLDDNYLNNLNKLIKKNVTLASRFNELEKAENSVVHSFYISAKNKIKRALGFKPGEYEKYDQEDILDEQLNNISEYNKGMDMMASYSREILEAAKSENIRKLLKIGKNQDMIDEAKKNKEDKQRALGEVKDYIPKNPWGSKDMITIALIKRVEDEKKDSEQELGLYEDALKGGLKNSQLFNTLKEMLSVSTSYLERRLGEYLRAEGLIRDSIPVLSIMEKQGFVTKEQEKQLSNLERTLLDTYYIGNEKESFSISKTPLGSYRSHISSFFGRYGQFGIDLESPNYLSDNIEE